LAAWMPSPMPGSEQDQGRVGQAGDLDLALTHAHGLDEDDVAARGIEHAQGLRRRPRESPEVPARGHRADEDALGRGRAPACGCGRPAAPRPRTATTGRRPARRRVARGAQPADQADGGGRLAHARRPGDAHDVGRARHDGASAPSLSQRGRARPRRARSAVRPRWSRVRSRATRSGDRRQRDCGVPRVAVRRLRRLGTRMIRASPWPPPPHRAAAPVPPPRRLSSRARCSTMRAPDMPTGGPVRWRHR
jgi:hypothetical protein